MDEWRAVASSQAGLITRSQLRARGITRQMVTHKVTTEPWQILAPTVVATFTGELTEDQRLWLGVLHAGPGSLIGGVHAAASGGLKNWHRDTVTMLVPYGKRVPPPLPGFRFVRSRRALATLRAGGVEPPTCLPIVAVLLFAAEQTSDRTAHGILAAVVQQRLASADMLLSSMDYLGRIRRAADLRQALHDIAGGSQSVAELDIIRLCRHYRLKLPDRQVKRRDSAGRVRFTDCEWRLDDQRILVLEVDGAFHMEAQHWEDDLARQRALTGGDRLIVRCTSRELREETEQIARDLERLGVPRAA